MWYTVAMISEVFIKRVYLLLDDNGEYVYGYFNYYPITNRMQFIKDCPPCLKLDPNKAQVQIEDGCTFFYWEGLT